MESSGNGACIYIYISTRALQGEPGGGILYWESWRICKGRFWKQAPLSIGAPMGNLKGVCLPGTFSDSKQALLKWHLSLSLSLSPPSQWQLCEGNLEGGLLYWGLSQTWNGRLWKWSISFRRLHKGNLRHLAREGSATKFVGQRNCPSTGHSPGLLSDYLLDITPSADTSIQWGRSTVPYAGGNLSSLFVWVWRSGDIQTYLFGLLFLGPQGC